MAFTLTSAGAAAVKVNGVPYARTSTYPVFEINEDTKLPTGRMSLIASYDKSYTIFPQTIYSELINGDTAAAFASLAELIDFVVNSVLTAGGSGTTGGGASFIFTIVAGAPANSNQKTAGATIQDDRLKDYDQCVMLINENIYQGGTLTFTKATGTLAPNPSVPTAFQPGDVVVVFASVTA